MIELAQDVLESLDFEDILSVLHKAGYRPKGRNRAELLSYLLSLSV